MDPQQTLWELLEAISADRRDYVQESLEQLQDWLSNGGFLPTVTADENGAMVVERSERS